MPETTNTNKGSFQLNVIFVLPWLGEDEFIFFCGGGKEVKTIATIAKIIPNNFNQVKLSLNHNKPAVTGIISDAFWAIAAVATPFCWVQIPTNLIPEIKRMPKAKTEENQGRCQMYPPSVAILFDITNHPHIKQVTKFTVMTGINFIL